MTTVTNRKPTRKQQQILDLLSEGKTPDQIAKRQKVTTNAIYGHLRRLRANGWIDGENNVLDMATLAIPPVSSNGSSENGEEAAADRMKNLIRNAIKVADTRLDEIDAERGEIKEEMLALDLRDKKLAEEEEFLRANEKALDAAGFTRS